jgi:hypothetical protein
VCDSDVATCATPSSKPCGANYLEIACEACLLAQLASCGFLDRLVVVHGAARQLIEHAPRAGSELACEHDGSVGRQRKGGDGALSAEDVPVHLGAIRCPEATHADRQVTGMAWPLVEKLPGTCHKMMLTGRSRRTVPGLHRDRERRLGHRAEPPDRSVLVVGRKFNEAGAKHRSLVWVGWPAVPQDTRNDPGDSGIDASELLGWEIAGPRTLVLVPQRPQGVQMLRHENDRARSSGSGLTSWVSALPRRQYPRVDEDDADRALAWLRERGWDVRVQERNLRTKFEEQGQRYAPTIDDPWWADLVRIDNPSFVVENYGSGKTPAAAILRAKQQYGSEQT